MSDDDHVKQLLERYRERHTSETRKARRRIWLTGALIVFCAGYMSYIHHSVSQLDAAAVTAIARQHVQDRLPEFGEQLTKVAIDAAPEVVDRGEQAIRAAPTRLRDALEERVLEGTDALIEEFTVRLDVELGVAFDTQMEAVNLAAERGKAPAPDAMMRELRARYREKASVLLDNLYLGFAEQIGEVDAQLVHLRDADDLTPREQVQREIVEATVVLRHHYVTPPPVGPLADVDTDQP